MKRVPLKNILKGTAPEMEALHETPLVIPEDFHALVVDDISINARVLARLLVRLGITSVDLAFSGEEACYLAARNKPSVVFTDVWMPGMDGLELRRCFRTDPQFADLPVIAVTADERPGERFDATGFSGVVKKPVTAKIVYDVLVQTIPALTPKASSAGTGMDAAAEGNKVQEVER